MLNNKNKLKNVCHISMGKKQKVPKQSAEWGKYPQRCLMWGARPQVVWEAPSRGGCSDYLSFNSNEPQQGLLRSWLLITKFSTNRNKGLWRNGWGRENTRWVWYILQRRKGSAQRVTVTCQRRQKWEDAQPRVPREEWGASGLDLRTSSSWCPGRAGGIRKGSEEGQMGK